MEKTNLLSKQKELEALGKLLFRRITTISRDIRDDKKRTGIRIIARVLRTDNRISIPVYTPSANADFYAVEKTVRTEEHSHITSQDSEAPQFFQFRGCVSYYCEETDEDIHVSVSGLMSNEDVAVALILMAILLDISLDKVMTYIQDEHDLMRNGETVGLLPEELFQEGHYLKVLLDEYREKTKNFGW